MARLGIPPENLNTLRYAGPRLSVSPLVDGTRRPGVLDRNYPLFTFWRVKTPVQDGSTEGEIWYLARFEGNGDATWLLLATGTSGPVTQLRTDDGNIVAPDGVGILDVDGIVVANATNSKPLFTDGAIANTAQWELQVGAAITGAPADTNDAGIVSFDDTQFTVDINGFVQMIGSAGPVVQTVTGDAGGAVGPDGAGNVNIFGVTVNNADNSKPVFVQGTPGSNLLEVDVQVATEITGAPADKNDAGLASFDDTQFIVDINGFVQLLNNPGPTAGISNLGFTLDSGTFSVASADGSALSATNPGFVTIWSKVSPGTLVTIMLTANQDIDDSNSVSSEIAGNLFGLTNNVDYAQDLPFRIYAVLNDDEDAIQFMLSRNFYRATSLSSGDIGTPSSPVADQQNDFWSFDDITTTEWDENPALPLGTILMRKTGTTANDWAVQTLSVGVGAAAGPTAPIGFPGLLFQNVFIVPTAQFGAATGSFLVDNGGTAPTFLVQHLNFEMLTPQHLRVFFYMNGNTATDGAGAVDAQIALPYTKGGLDFTIEGTGFVSCVGYTGLVGFDIEGGVQVMTMRDINGNILQNSDFSDGSRVLQGSVIYRTGDNP